MFADDSPPQAEFILSNLLRFLERDHTITVDVLGQAVIDLAILVRDQERRIAKVEEKP
jgi:hypothetical protein